MYSFLPQQLRHENLINLIEVFRRKKRLYLVFEFVDRTALDDLERYPTGADESYCKKVMWQVMKGVEFCHGHNVSCAPVQGDSTYFICACTMHNYMYIQLLLRVKSFMICLRYISKKKALSGCRYSFSQYSISRLYVAGKLYSDVTVAYSRIACGYDDDIIFTNSPWRCTFTCTV